MFPHALPELTLTLPTSTADPVGMLIILIWFLLPGLVVGLVHAEAEYRYQTIKD